MGQKPTKSYYTDALANYLILHCPASALEGYQYRMLAVNRIQGLLPCSMRGIDGETYLYYEITSRQSLARRYDHNEISGKEMKSILYALCRVFHTLAEYLLDNTRIFLDPEYIFYDFESEEFCFTYYPEKISENGLSQFLEYLAEHVDSECAEAVAVIYRLCDLSCQAGFILREELLDHEYEMALVTEDVQESISQGGLPRDKDPDLRVRNVDGESGDQTEEDDLLWEEEEPYYRKKQKKAAKKRKAEKKRSEKKRAEKEGPSLGKILALAIMFLMLSGGLWMLMQFTVLSVVQVTAARVGIIGGLVISLVLAVAGIILIVRRNKEDDRVEMESRKEEQRNAMMPSAEYPSGKN